jgi:hypothetical protein
MNTPIDKLKTLFRLPFQFDLDIRNTYFGPSDGGRVGLPGARHVARYRCAKSCVLPDRNAASEGPAAP